MSDDPEARGGSRPLPLSYAGCEFLLTTFLLFSVVTAVRWLRDPGSGVYIASLRPALAALAGLTAVLLVVLVLSPPGRRSGGHMNPAVTIALWLMDVFPGASVVPYVAAQLAGSATGVALGRLVWGPVVGTAIRYAALGASTGSQFAGGLPGRMRLHDRADRPGRKFSRPPCLPPVATGDDC